MPCHKYFTQEKLFTQEGPTEVKIIIDDVKPVIQGAMKDRTIIAVCCQIFPQNEIYLFLCFIAIDHVFFSPNLKVFDNCFFHFSKTMTLVVMKL